MIEKGDYLICTPSGSADAPLVKRAFLVKASGQHKGIVSGIVEKLSHLPGNKNLIELPLTDVVLNLGPKPRGGKVHGVDVTTRFVGRKIHDQFGDICFFYKPEAEIGTQILQAFTRAYKVLKHNRLDFLVRPDNSVWEILPHNGEKYAGMYMRPKTDKLPHRFQIRPEICAATEWSYVIFHELAHYMHLGMGFSDKLDAKWIKVYNTSINLTSVKKEQCQQFIDQLMEGEERPSDFKTNLDEESTAAWKAVIKTIKLHHNISIKELDQLFLAGERDEIKALWPTRVNVKELAPVVSEYACVNYKELFAESFAFHMTKRKLPKALVKLLEETISYVRAHQEK